ncbi:apoptosis antagonizing transcription factor-domain-containing protein [Aspergillus filifer]
MAPKSLAEQIAELEDVTPRDYDPEDIERGGNTSDEDDAPVKDADAGREHYQAVGKAKLRNEDPVSLGKQYAGSRVSRDALMEESDDDPFNLRSSDEEGSEDDEEDEDEDISESEDEKPRKSKTGGKKNKVEESDDMDTDGSEDEEDEEDIDGFDSDEDEDDSDEEGSDEDLDDEDEESEEESDEELAKPNLKSKSKSKRSEPSTSADDDRSELRALMATDQKSIAATLSAASKADATKGKAVKQQRATFDALLNARIKLQKGLTASNQLATATATATEDKSEVDTEALKSAESAALTLWSTLEELRLTLVDAQNPDESKKRKRPAPPTPATPTSTLWTRMSDLETPSLQHRRAILDKWSLKVRNSSGSTLANSKGKLLGSNAQQQTITAVLDAHIASETADLRAAKKSRISSNSDSNSPEDSVSVYVYDDTATYQALLRDLVSQRMSSSDSITNGLDTLHLLPSRTHHITGMRKDKVKRDVDTRASKGRKMRFDVHEKLQNFMAPEDRGTWTGRAREEFFASLLGRSAAGLLGEDSEDETGGVDGEGESEDEVEGGLRLFRG